MKPALKLANTLQGAGIAAAAILSLCMFFRFGILSGFNVLFGDSYDGLIEASILEHWTNVFRGVSGWKQTFSFHPVRATLGYNDGFLIYGAIHSVFRTLGADPFLASECVNIAVKLVGFAGFYAFATRALALAPGWAALGASVFTVSNNSYMQGSHVQLFGVAFAPVLATLLWHLAAGVGQRSRWAVAGWGVAAALLSAAWLLTGFYMAWFFAVFCVLWLPLLAWTAGWRRLRAFAADSAACWLPLAGSAGLLGLGIIPFLRLYLPKAAEGVHEAAEMASYLLSPLDTLHLAGDSLLYAGWQAWLRPLLSPNLEHATGFTPVLLTLFVASAVWVVRQRRVAGVAASMALASGVLWLMATSFGGVSFWTIVFDHVPGAKAIRVVSRIQIFLAWPVVSVTVAGLAAAAAKLRSAKPYAPIAAGAIGLLLILEQVNQQQVPALDRGAQIAWLRAMPAPPKECRSFAVSEPRPADPRFGVEIANMVSHNIDAMMLAEWHRLPTLNGFASLLPPGWNLLGIDRPDYLWRVRAYATAAGVAAGLCTVSLRLGTWNTQPFIDDAK